MIVISASYKFYFIRLHDMIICCKIQVIKIYYLNRRLCDTSGGNRFLARRRFSFDNSLASRFGCKAVEIFQIGYSFACEIIRIRINKMNLIFLLMRFNKFGQIVD